MRISVRVKTGAKENLITKKNGLFLIALKSRPIEGRANSELVKLLAKYFNVPQARISIESGHKSKNKLIQVLY